ncbi:MAG: hypothetical protein N2C14_22145 [Planctomycetales bacterium]
MSVAFEILGKPGRDNAALFRVNTGQSLSRLLFDCGEGCLSSLSVGEIQAIDDLFFSHFHMDHVCGFDSFSRHNFGRPGARSACGDRREPSTSCIIGSGVFYGIFIMTARELGW